MYASSNPPNYCSLAKIMGKEHKCSKTWGVILKCLKRKESLNKYRKKEKWKLGVKISLLLISCFLSMPILSVILTYLVCASS